MPRLSPLDSEHRALGARMVEFGGWTMPIQYTGVLEEHRACRERAVIFDVSHLGSVRVKGAGAFDALQWAFTNDLRRIEPGRAQYTHLLDPADAHVVDDVIVWWIDPADFIVMPNASNTDRLVGALEEAVGEQGRGDATVEDITATRVVLAVQGPQARSLLAGVTPAAAEIPRFAVGTVELGGASGYAAGTGYTGEDGVELHVPAPAAATVWHAIINASVTPAGLGARDTLRLEAGLPLHGHELGPGITPLQAGLAWVVRFDKGDFRGRDPLVAERERGPARLLRGLVTDGRQIPRAECKVLINGEVAGEVTSGNFSPMLERGIALAFLPPAIADGARVDIEIRDRLAPATVTKPPFVPR
ncbi:MAG: glycine cleavage system aminomethyltransferase GcvT [Actinobacteria bacterium]|nr:MAG: glycine cleavage system aminomethyltransferase GcvT [Actinomycetota bacterium]